MADAPPKSGEYQDGRLWFTRKGAVVTVGVTDLAIEDVGATLSVEFPSEGADFQKGEILLTVMGETGRLEVSAPASGIVKELNEVCSEEPATVSDDPLEEGWLVKLEIEDTSELQEYAAEASED